MAGEFDPKTITLLLKVFQDHVCFAEAIGEDPEEHWARYRVSCSCGIGEIVSGDAELGDAIDMGRIHSASQVLHALADAGLLVKPGVWSLPPEPGPEVKAVRDCDGNLWNRATIAPFDEGWYLDDLNGAPHPWVAVIGYTPLTDATAEVQS